MANPCNRGRSRTSSPTTITLPTNPCEALAVLRQQYLLLTMGQAVTAIETPELGRVEFSAAHLDQMRLEMDRLAAECSVLNGGTTGMARRKPISIQAWP